MTKHQSTILSVAITLAEKVGYQNVSRDLIAEKIGRSMASVSYHWGAIADLHDAVMVCAVRDSNLKIIAQGLVNKHKTALKAPPHIKKAAAELLAA